MKNDSFELRYNVTGSERKRLVAAMEKILEVKPKYLGAPSFAYEVDSFTVSKDGTISFGDRAGSEKIETLLECLHEQGFDAEPRFEDLRMTEEEELGLGRQRREDPQGENGMQSSDVPENRNEDEVEEAGDSLVISYPRKDISDAALDNLRLLVESKETLIKKALGAAALPIEVSKDKVSFPWFTGWPTSEEVSAYAYFTGKLLGMAKTQKRVTAKEKETDNDKYAFRCFLLRLGFIGEEYKKARKILLRNLTGSSAFKVHGDKGFSQGDLEKAKADPDTRAEIKAVLDGEDGGDDE